MKKIFAFAIAFLMLVFLTGTVQAQVSLDQHNWSIWDDSVELVGAKVDTSAIIPVGKYAHFAIWAEYDSMAASDSGHCHIIWDVSAISDTAYRFWWQAMDTLICSTAVANLPAMKTEDISSTIGDMPYARFRTVATMGTNDSVRVVIKLFMRE